MKPDAPGLRARKRRQTRHDLEEAAVSLVLRDGLETLTVDAISERANVSTRTFFNYFDSKEDAILGAHQAGTSDEELAAYRAGQRSADLAEALVGLVFIVFGPAIADPTFRESRLRVLGRYPQLLGRQLARLERTGEQLTGAAQQLLAERGVDASDAVADTLVMACAGAIRATAREWAVTGQEISLGEMERRAVSLVREAAGRLS